MVCDFMELYRYLIDDFLMEHCRNLKKKDFKVKTENFGRKKQAKREYLKNQQTRELMAKLNIFFNSNVEIPRIKIGNKQSLETLINEETLLFAQFLRFEKRSWIPRLGTRNNDFQ